MKSTSEINTLMVEFLENCPDFKLNQRGIEIINEIADYAEQTNIYKDNAHKGKMFEGANAKTIFCYMLDRVVNAPTVLHRNASVLLIMPFVRKQVRAEMIKGE